MNEKQQRSYDLQERLIEFAVRVLDVVDPCPINTFLPFITPCSIFDIPSSRRKNYTAIPSPPYSPLARQTPKN